MERLGSVWDDIRECWKTPERLGEFWSFQESFKAFERVLERLGGIPRVLGSFGMFGRFLEHLEVFCCVWKFWES